MATLGAVEENKCLQTTTIDIWSNITTSDML